MVVLVPKRSDMGRRKGVMIRQNVRMCREDDVRGVSECLIVTGTVGMGEHLLFNHMSVNDNQVSANDILMSASESNRRIIR